MPRREQQHQQHAGRPDARGRLVVRPGAVPPSPEPARRRGEQPLGLARGRDGLLYVPAGYRDERPAPLIVLLHGAGGDARSVLSLLRAHADAGHFLVLAPDSRRDTWDVIRDGHYGPDVAYLDAALAGTFGRCAVDPAHVAVSGFSDGASYALSLGVANGGLFTHAIAFSPGFMAPPAQEGTPRIFISHGTRDTVLPIDRCSRRVVPQLERAQYEVRYVEFDGGHTVPPEIARDAVGWFLNDEHSDGRVTRGK